MLDTLRKITPTDPDLPPRAARIDLLTRVLNGTIYNVLQHEFHEEKNGIGEYVKLAERRPSVRTGIIRSVVDDSVSLLFSEGHFPAIQCKDDAVVDALKAITKDAKINQVMVEATTIGSVGSVCIWVRFLASRVFLSVLNTATLTPVWNDKEPDVLAKVVEKFKVKGAQLTAAGYAGMKASANYWFQREWDTTSETWYLPQLVSESKASTPVVDTSKSVAHNLGFVPMVWVKNLPGGDDVDGSPTFDDDAINTVMEADYLLSQGGRGLKYASDPTLLIKEPTGEGKNMVRGAANAIVVGADGDAKLLEINGTASEAVIKYVERLRELAIEHLHGNRSTPDKMGAAQSGRAIELLHQPLIWLADRLRVSYGEGALLDIYRMIIAGSQKFPITIRGVKYPVPANADISLRWAPWFAPTVSDLQNLALALDTMIDAGVLSRATGIKYIAETFDIEDVVAEEALIDAERVKLLAELPTPASKVSETV